MDIFKLFYDHDLRLNDLTSPNGNSSEKSDKDRLAEFMSPDPTYSKFYITGTRLEEEKFGINALAKFDEVIARLDNIFGGLSIYTETGTFHSLAVALSTVKIGQAMIISGETISPNFGALNIDEGAKVGRRENEIRPILQAGSYVLYKEKAQDGFDLHLFSERNIYPSLFEAFKPLIDDRFRFFSINRKKMRTERQLYFETRKLEKPPHGAEEVLPETVL